VFRSNTLNILTRSYLSSHLLAVLAQLKPTPNKTNLAAQSIYIYIYDSRSNKNQKTNKTKLRESIRNMNKTEDSNKNKNKSMQNDEKKPKYVGYDENKLQEMKTTKRK